MRWGKRQWRNDETTKSVARRTWRDTYVIFCPPTFVLAFPTWPEERTDKLISAYRCRTPGEEVICLMAALKKQAVHIALYQTLMISFFPFDSISILSGRVRMMMASNQDVMRNKVSGRWSGRKQSQLSPHRVQAAVIVHILA